MLSGLVGAVFFAALPATAADIYPTASADLTKPAVDGINGKFEALGGSYAKKSLYGVAGSLAVPLDGQFGAQVDGALGSFDDRTVGAVAGHFFWRNPAQGLLGLYADHSRWDQLGGIHVSHVGGEGEAYWGRWSLHAVTGVEFGNNDASSGSISTTGPSGGFTLTTTTPSVIPANATRFFDKVDLSYYVTDDWKAFAGHRYMGGKNALALGSEYALASGSGTKASLFAEGRLGEGSNNYGVWGGLRIYFGQKDKSLIRRHREDDPLIDWTPDSLFDLVSAIGNPGSTTHSCSGGEQFINGVCTSDIRLKRDIVLLARLDNGIGLYRYRYIWSDTIYVGVMAQEVAPIVPDAVILAEDGYFRVDYARLGMRLLTWDEWTAIQAEMAAPLAA